MQVEFRLKFDLVDATWLTTNANGVPEESVPIFRLADGKYSFGDGIKKVSELTWFGGSPALGSRQVAFGNASTGEITSSGNLIFYDNYASSFYLDIATYTQIGGGGSTSFVRGAATNFKVGRIGEETFLNFDRFGQLVYSATSFHGFLGGNILHYQPQPNTYHGVYLHELGGYEQGFFSCNAFSAEVKIGSNANYYTALYSGGSLGLVLTGADAEFKGKIKAPLRVGNSGLLSGQFYKDTATNIINNGDLLIGIKA